MNACRPEKAVLSNGLVLLTVERPRLPVAAVMLMYRAGSLYEPEGKTGLAHLTEHMMFRGTPSHPRGEIDRLIGRLGGTSNAMTTCDHALYYFTVPSEHWEVPLRIEADRMFHCELSADSFDVEQKVTIEERMMLEDDPEAVIYETVDSLAFESHPYRYPVVGLPEDLADLSRSDVTGFYSSRYRPSEAVLAVVGDVDGKAVRDAVERLFGAQAEGGGREAEALEAPLESPVTGARPPGDPRRAEPPLTEARSEILSGLSPTPMIVTGFRTPEATHEDTPALVLLAGLLSSGRSSLLYSGLVDGDRIAMEVSASLTPQLDPGLFYVSASLNSGASPAECEERVLAMLRAVADSPPSEQALERARNLTRVDLVLSRETCLGAAGALAFWESLGDWGLGDEHERRLAEVTAEDVRRAAADYFDPNARSSAWLVP